MSHKNNKNTSGGVFNDSPFASLDLTFSTEEIKAYEVLKSAEADLFPGGVVKVRLEKSGRGGKIVTLFFGFEKEQGNSLEKILTVLKQTLGTGGKIVDGNVELQGDQRRKSIEWFQQNGYKVKGEII